MIAKKNIYNFLYLFLLLHLILWILVPTFSNKNLPLDTIEALAWGSNLDWGFNKHPPMSAFVIELFYQIFGNRDWAYYFLSQIFILSAFFIIFKFSEEFFENKKLAFLSVLLLEGIFFYNFTSPEFNVNVCQIPFWAASIYFAWKCFKTDKLINYIFLGLSIGLGVLSKYLFIYLIIGIKLFFIFLIFKKKKIKILRLFITGILAFIILLPHIIWLVENEFSTITYGFGRTGGPGEFLDHLLYPIVLFSKQLGILIPFLIMSSILVKRFKFKINFKDEKFVFLFFVFITPILLIFVTSLLAGVKIRTMWMTPFYLFSGVFIIYFFKKNLISEINKKFIFFFFFLFFLSPITYGGFSIIDKTKRTDYPGKEIAYLVQGKWDKNFRNDIKIVIGDEWYAGNLSYHLNARPKWMQTLNNDLSTSSSEGGIIYTGNPEILKKVCPGVYGTIKPVGYCMIGIK